MARFHLRRQQAGRLREMCRQPDRWCRSATAGATAAAPCFYDGRAALTDPRPRGRSFDDSVEPVFDGFYFGRLRRSCPGRSRPSLRGDDFTVIELNGVTVRSRRTSTIHASDCSRRIERYSSSGGWRSRLAQANVEAWCAGLTSIAEARSTAAPVIGRRRNVASDESPCRRTRDRSPVNATSRPRQMADAEDQRFGCDARAPRVAVVQ